MHLTPAEKEEIGLLEFQEQVVLAEEIGDETLKAYVAAVKEILTTQTKRNTRRMVILAVHAVSRVPNELPVSDPRCLFFETLGNRLTRILDGDLRRAVEAKNWMDAYYCRRDIYGTIVDAIKNYPEE